MDRKKYPWTKAENESDKRIENFSEPEADFPEPPPAPPPGQTLEKPVYAGPEFMGRRPRERSNDGENAGRGYIKGHNEPPVQAVYAAPRIIDRKGRPRAEKVYAGPEFPKKEPEMIEVYAGPEYFERRSDLPDDAPAVPPFMAVYAGPEYFSGINGQGAGAYVPRCEKCGAIVKESYKFCPECGAPLTKKI